MQPKLYQKMEDEFESVNNKSMLEKKKEILKQIRDIHKPIDHTELDAHS